MDNSEFGLNTYPRLAIHTSLNDGVPVVIRNVFTVAVYTRISPKGTGKRKDEEASLDIQQTDILKEINERGDFHLFKIYSETVSGNLSFENRPIGTDLLNDAVQGKFNLVIIWDNDRLGRDREGMAAQIFRHKMRGLGIQVYSLHQPQILKSPDEYKEDPYDDGQILMEKIQDWQSASTVNKFCHRSMRGKDERARDGKMLTTPPYGYKLESKKDEKGEVVVRKDGRVVHMRVVNEPEKIIVIRAYHEYVFEGKSFNEIRDGLNADQIPTRKGRSWERAMVARILKNPVYFGLLVYNKHFRRKNPLTGGSRWGENPQEKWIITPPDKTEHEAIISKELFDKAQNIRESKLRIGAVAVYNDFLFSGLIRCGCKSKMYRTKVSSYYTRKIDGITTKSQCNGYICGRWQRFKDTDRNYISEKDLKEVIFSDLKKFKENPLVLSGFIEESKQKDLNHEKDILTSKRKALIGIPSRRGRLLKAYELGRIPLDRFSEADGNLEKEEKNLRLEIGRSEQNVGRGDKKELSRSDFLEAIQKFEGIFEIKDIRNQKDFLRSLIESIVVEKGKITINYLLNNQEPGK